MSENRRTFVKGIGVASMLGFSGIAAGNKQKAPDFDPTVAEEVRNFLDYLRAQTASKRQEVFEDLSNQQKEAVRDGLKIGVTTETVDNSMTAAAADEEVVRKNTEVNEKWGWELPSEPEVTDSSTLPSQTDTQTTASAREAGDSVQPMMGIELPEHVEEALECVENGNCEPNGGGNGGSGPESHNYTDTIIANSTLGATLFEWEINVGWEGNEDTDSVSGVNVGSNATNLDVFWTYDGVQDSYTNNNNSNFTAHRQAKFSGPGGFGFNQISQPLIKIKGYADGVANTQEKSLNISLDS